MSSAEGAFLILGSCFKRMDLCVFDLVFRVASPFFSALATKGHRPALLFKKNQKQKPFSCERVDLLKSRCTDKCGEWFGVSQSSLVGMRSVPAYDVKPPTPSFLDKPPFGGSLSSFLVNSKGGKTVNNCEGLIGSHILWMDKVSRQVVRFRICTFSGCHPPVWFGGVSNIVTREKGPCSRNIPPPHEPPFPPETNRPKCQRADVSILFARNESE